jgi:hypothetical protein
MLSFVGPSRLFMGSQAFSFGLFCILLCLLSPLPDYSLSSWSFYTCSNYWELENCSNSQQFELRILFGSNPSIKLMKTTCLSLNLNSRMKGGQEGTSCLTIKQLKAKFKRIMSVKVESISIVALWTHCRVTT